MDAFRTKLDAAQNQCFVDVAFWGGIVPGNAVSNTCVCIAFNQFILFDHCLDYIKHIVLLCFQGELKPMLNAGVIGFKCFLIHSGVDDFPHVERADLETALQTLQGTDATVLVGIS